jgi:hypothetical protein
MQFNYLDMTEMPNETIVVWECIVIGSQWY